MPQLVGGCVHHVVLRPVPAGGAILHLFQDDWPVADDAVGVGFDPQVGGTHRQQLRWGDGGGRGWGTKGEEQHVMKTISKESSRQIQEGRQGSSADTLHLFI